MENVSMAGSHAGGASHGAAPDVFHDRFSDQERKELLAEDLEAQMGISVVLGALIFAGMLLGITAVLLVMWLKV